MISPAVESFLRPMRRMFVVPQGLEADEFYEELVEGLASYSPAQFAAAVAWFRDNRENRTFPTVAECRRACEQAPIASTDDRYRSFARKRDDARSEEGRHRHARILCRCDMGRQADREGWLVALIEFAEDNERLPIGPEVRKVQAKALMSEDGLANGRGVPQFERLCELRKAMLERAHQEVFGAAPSPPAIGRPVAVAGTGRTASATGMDATFPAGGRAFPNARFTEAERAAALAKLAEWERALPKEAQPAE